MRRVMLLLVVAVLMVAGCARSTTRDSEQPTQPLLAFTATTLDGKPFDGMSLSAKPVVLWFWAPWCPTCLQQAPGVREALTRYRNRVAIVGVAGLDKTAAMPEFVRLAKVDGMTHLADEAGVVWKRFEVAAQSTFIFINASGQITFRGQLTAGEIPDRVAALLA